MFKNPTTLAYIFGAILVLLLLQLMTLFVLRKFGKNPKYVLSRENVGRLSLPMIFVAIAIRIESFHSKIGLVELLRTAENGHTTIYLRFYLAFADFPKDYQEKDNSQL